MQITLWSIVAMSQCAIKGKSGFYATRSILGLLEVICALLHFEQVTSDKKFRAGLSLILFSGFPTFIPLESSRSGSGIAVRTPCSVMTTNYSACSYFWTTLSATTIVTSLLAFALLHMRGVAGWAGWRWLFLIEGIITFTVGVASFFMMPASAVQTKAWFRPNGWFTEREIKIVVNRILRDDPSKGDMHNRQAVTPRRLWNAAKDFDLWPLYAIGLVAYIPQSPVGTYITLTLKSVGFSTFNTNLLTIPSSAAHIITLILITRLSEWTNERTLVSMIQPLWTLPCLIALRFWPGSLHKAWGTYALVSVLLSYPYCHAILVAVSSPAPFPPNTNSNTPSQWTSKNSNNVGARSVSAALYNMSVQLGNICANFIYRNDDKPYYHRGNRNLIIINLLSIVLFLFTKVYYIWRNKQKQRIWNALSPEEQREYKVNTKLEGSRRLDFQFAH